jgi:hypothetical protein
VRFLAQAGGTRWSRKYLQASASCVSISSPLNEAGDTFAFNVGE